MLNQASLHQCLKLLPLGTVSILTTTVQLFSSSLAWGTPRQLCPKSLPEEIHKILQQPHLQRTRWGLSIRISDQPSEAPLYSKNSTQFFVPASTAKLFTTAAALSKLGPTFRVQTKLYGQGTLPHLKQLRVVGQGDPSLTNQGLTALAKKLQAQGLKKIGTLIGDDRAFGGATIVPSWEWEDLQTSDGVPINSLNFNQNSLPIQISPRQLGQPLQVQWPLGKPFQPLVINNQTRTVSRSEPEFISLERNLSGTQITVLGQLQVGARPDTSYVAIADPSLYFLQRFRNVLNAHGIEVAQIHPLDNNRNSWPIDASPQAEVLLGQIESPPLSELIQTVNQDSNNFYAESLLRLLGQSSPHQTTPYHHISLTHLKSQLGALGVEPTGYHLQDGSGLSRQNLVSPDSLVSTLMVMERSQQKFAFRNSLAIAASRGTLKHRFQGTSVANRLFAKTGTLKGTVTIAGYLQPPQHPEIAFSIMANHSDQSTPELRQAIDQIIIQISQLRRCPS